MNMISVSSPTPNCPLLPPFRSPHSSLHSKLAPAVPASLSSVHFHPLRVSVDDKGRVSVMKRNMRGFGTICYASPLSARNVQWISTIASVVLMFAKGTAINKSFLPPIFALLAPSAVTSWIKGQYGIWAAFLALLVRLFFSIPGELELPLAAVLLVVLAPSQVMNLKGTQEGAILTLVMAAYLAFRHFSGAGSLKKAFEQGSIVSTLAIICITSLPCLLLL